MNDLEALAARVAGRKPRNLCARCGWHWFKHKNNRCKGLPRNKDGSYPRFTAARAQEPRK